jgi:release factor glutamine methyltransferase
VLGCERIELYTSFDRVLEKAKLEELHGLVKRCAEHEPVAYLVGRCEFYSLPIKVNSSCLIPRPETELLVERAIDFLRGRNGEQVVLDMCTGSGCIAVAIAKNFTGCHVTATDICDEALSVAQENVTAHGLGERVRLLCGDLFDPIIEGLDEAKFDLIVCNPPYVTTTEMDQLDKNVKDYEPHKALHAGAEGLDVYRRIAAEIEKFLKPDAALLLEIGYAQGKAVTELLEQTRIFTEIKIEKDRSDNDRIVIAKKG